MRFRSVLISLALATSLPAIAGCSSSDSGGGSQSPAPQTISKELTAAQGGTVDGPGVKLVVPPGALKADTTVTITITDKGGAPAADKIASSSVFDFGPDGTTFNAPVALTLDFSAAGAPAGATPKIAFLKDGAWQTLDDSAATGGQITATTTHFTPFTVIWTGGQQTGGGCASLDFTPCGGDITGTWTFSAGCVDLGAASKDPTGGNCPTATAAATVDFSGTITFGADATFNVNTMQSATISFDVPKTCLPSGATCADVNSKAVDNGSSCTMTQVEDPKTSTDQGTYRTDGNTFITKSTGDSTEDAPISYCVTGTTLKAKQLDKSGNTVIYVANKQ